MKRRLDTVYVTPEGTALRKDGETLVAEAEGAAEARASLHMLSSAAAFGPILVSPALIGACVGAGITLALLDRGAGSRGGSKGPSAAAGFCAAPTGRRKRARTSRVPSGRARSPTRAPCACGASRPWAEMTPKARAALEAACGRMAHVLRRAAFADRTLEEVRGSAGEAATLCFGAFDGLIRAPGPELRWRGRSRRPPVAAMEALLPFLCTLLVHDCRKRLRGGARACQDWGQRVQFSAFEIEVDPGQRIRLKARREGLIDPGADSLRYSPLGADRTRRAEHVGAKAAADPGGPLIP